MMVVSVVINNKKYNNYGDIYYDSGGDEVIIL